MSIEEIIQKKQGTIIDVRTNVEFQGGHAVGSINIPLHDITQKLEEIKSMKTPLVFCCASGNRSGQATQYILQQNIECYNGGSWMDVNHLQSQNA